MKKSLLLASSLLISSFSLMSCGTSNIKSEALYVADYARYLPVISYTATVDVTVQVMKTSSTEGGTAEFWLTFHDEIATSEVSLHGSLIGKEVTKVEKSEDAENAVVVTLKGDCTASSSYNLGFIAFASTSFDAIRDTVSGATVYAVALTGETSQFVARDYTLTDNSGWL